MTENGEYIIEDGVKCDDCLDTGELYDGKNASTCHCQIEQNDGNKA